MASPRTIRKLKNGLRSLSGWWRVLFLSVWLWNAGFLLAAEPVETPTAGPAVSSKRPVEGGEEDVLSPGALELFRIGPVPITNSMVMGWLAAGVLAALSLRFYHQMKAGRNTIFTASVECLVVFLYDFLADIMGKGLARKTFWLMGSVFIYILCSNLLGLFPGIGSIGWGHVTEHMFKVTTPLFRGVNADLNTTLALGALFFLFWFIWAWKVNGPIGIIKHIFGFEGEASGMMHLVMAVVFLAVGFLEILSIIIRPFSLALRLYGNIFAGEVVLETMLHKIPAIGWLLPVPFYLMEVLVGLIQAMVFMLLSAVFVMLICRHESEEAHPEQDAKTE
ncbi:MAG: F0F1 ATP synthase subunit A [Kiritimatiellales bacterium]